VFRSLFDILWHWIVYYLQLLSSRISWRDSLHLQHSCSSALHSIHSNFIKQYFGTLNIPSGMHTVLFAFATYVYSWCDFSPCRKLTEKCHGTATVQTLQMLNVTECQLLISYHLWFGHCLISKSSFKAKFHYSIQLANHLAIWFTSCSATCEQAAIELDSVMEFGLSETILLTSRSATSSRAGQRVIGQIPLCYPVR